MLSDSVDIMTPQMIVSSQLFIGIISNNGVFWKRVINEWEIAKNYNVPSILLIEEGVNVDPSLAGKFIRFNRHSPEHAIAEIQHKMTSPATTNVSNDWGWLIVGAALIGLFALFNGKK